MQEVAREVGALGTDLAEPPQATHLVWLLTAHRRCAVRRADEVGLGAMARPSREAAAQVRACQSG